MPSKAVAPRRRAPGRRRGPKLATPTATPAEQPAAADALVRLLRAAEASAPAGSAAKRWFAALLAGDAAEVAADGKKAA